MGNGTCTEYANDSTIQEVLLTSGKLIVSRYLAESIPTDAGHTLLSIAYKQFYTQLT